MLNLALLTIGAPEEVDLMNASLVDAGRGGYMNSAGSLCHADKILMASRLVKRRRDFSGYKLHLQKSPSSL
jgi:hypothetical protein